MSCAAVFDDESVMKLPAQLPSCVEPVVLFMTSNCFCAFMLPDVRCHDLF